MSGFFDHDAYFSAMRAAAHFSDMGTIAQLENYAERLKSYASQLEAQVAELRQEQVADRKKIVQLHSYIESEKVLMNQKLKRQGAETFGLQKLYDNLVSEAKYDSDMLNIASFDPEKSLHEFSTAYKKFMNGNSLTYSSHRHTNIKSIVVDSSLDAKAKSPRPK